MHLVDFSSLILDVLDREIGRTDLQEKQINRYEVQRLNDTELQKQMYRPILSAVVERYAQPGLHTGETYVRYSRGIIPEDHKCMIGMNSSRALQVNSVFTCDERKNQPLEDPNSRPHSQKPEHNRLSWLAR